MTFRDTATGFRFPFLLLFLAQGALAQSTLATYPGNSPFDRMQVSIGGRDLDGDAVGDFLVAAPHDGADAGVVYAYAGGSGALLWTAQGADGERLGHALAFVEDLTGDGVPDLLVGAPGATLAGKTSGSVRIHSGATGAEFLEVWGDQHGEEFGYSVASGFDYDKDGVEDLAIGAPFAGNGAFFQEGGQVWILSGATAVLLDTLAFYAASAHGGFALAGVGDVDQDGYGDLAVSAPDIDSTTEDEAGAVWVFSDGFILQFRYGEMASERLGWSIAPADDHDLDGHPDYLVGSPGWSGDRGRVQLVSGDTGDVLADWEGDADLDRLGTALARIGDVDGDGTQDFVAGAPQPGGAGPGYARVYSLAPGTALFTRTGEGDDDLFGERVGGIGDVNDDGVPDVGVGDPGWDAPGAFPFKLNVGRVTLFSGGGPGFVSYCTAGASASGCQARLAGSGTPSASQSSGFTLSATGVEGDKSGIFFYGTNGRQANPWGNGTSFQCVVPPVKRAGVLAIAGTAGACDGSSGQDLNAYWQANPNKNPGAGAVVQVQLWYRDPFNTSNLTTSLSDALELVVGN